MTKVLYIHGMGGGSDSRIPSILAVALKPLGAHVVVRTYDFNPETGHEQIKSWVEELSPALIIGESLGAVHALRIRGIPHLLISPAVNAPLFLRFLSFLTWFPGITFLFDRIYRPREGDRQLLHFSYDNLKHYGSHRKAALANSTLNGSKDVFVAFIGRRDHYRKTGVVSIRTWKKYFGDTCSVYDGSHFTEEEHIQHLILPVLCKMLEINI